MIQDIETLSTLASIWRLFKFEVFNLKKKNCDNYLHSALCCPTSFSDVTDFLGHNIVEKIEIALP